MLKNILITYILLISKSISFDCLKIQNFENSHLSELKNKKIEEQWNKNKKLGIGTYGIVKPLNWLDYEIAAKKIIIEVEDIPQEKTIKKIALVQKEINFFEKFGQTVNEYFPLFYGCTKDKKEKDDPIEFFIFYEKFYADLTKKNKKNFLNKVPLIKRVKLYLKILKALKILQNNNLVHGDIKPANLMITSSTYENVKLIDFGMVGEINEIYKGGSPSYNSPEKINDNKTKNNTSQDLWAFALTIATIEEKKIFLFKNVDEKCFLIFFSMECYEKLMDNVVNVFKEAFGKNNVFGNVLLNFLKFDVNERMDLDEGILNIEEFVINFENEERNNENEEINNKIIIDSVENEEVSVFENDLLKNNINNFKLLIEKNALHNPDIGRNDKINKIDIRDKYQMEEEINFDLLSQNYSRENLELIKTINQEEDLDLSKFENNLIKKPKNNFIKLKKPQKPIIYLKRKNFFKDMDVGNDLKKIIKLQKLKKQNEIENNFQMRNENKIKIENILNKQKMENIKSQNKGLIKDNRKIDNKSIIGISKELKNLYNEKIMMNRIINDFILI